MAKETQAIYGMRRLPATGLTRQKRTMVTMRASTRADANKCCGRRAGRWGIDAGISGSKNVANQDAEETSGFAQNETAEAKAFI